MGTALLILAEIFGWGVLVLVVGATLEAIWARVRRRTKRTLVE